VTSCRNAAAIEFYGETAAFASPLHSLICGDRHAAYARMQAFATGLQSSSTHTLTD